MLKKRRMKKDGVVKVTFSLPEDAASERVELTGEWNDWQPESMERQKKDGTWRRTVDLEPDARYQFRYRVDGDRWTNDPQADGYTDNPYGDQNSVVET